MSKILLLTRGRCRRKNLGLLHKINKLFQTLPADQSYKTLPVECYSCRTRECPSKSCKSQAQMCRFLEITKGGILREWHTSTFLAMDSDWLARLELKKLSKNLSNVVTNNTTIFLKTMTFRCLRVPQLQEYPRFTPLVQETSFPKCTDLHSTSRTDTYQASSAKVTTRTTRRAT